MFFTAVFFLCSGSLTWYAGLQGCAELSQPGVYSCVSVSSLDQPTELTTELLNVNARLCQDIHPNLSSLAHQNGLVFNFFLEISKRRHRFKGAFGSKTQYISCTCQICIFILFVEIC